MKDILEFYFKHYIWTTGNTIKLILMRHVLFEKHSIAANQKKN